MLLFVLDKVSSVPPLYWIRPKCITLYNGLLRLGNTQDDSLIPALVTRLEQAERKIQELSDRVLLLESELTQHQDEGDHEDGNNTPESSSTFCSAQPNGFADADADHQTSFESNNANGHEEQPKTDDQQNDDDHPKSNGTTQPPAPPSVDNFKFTSTPNPVFLSRGKLHHKALSGKGSKSGDVSPSKNPSSEMIFDAEDFKKSKKQRVIPDELIQQKKLLRKMTLTNGHAGKKNAVNHSIEEDDDSLSTLMKNALKRKFANVDVSSFNNSHASEETTITDFSM